MNIKGVSKLILTTLLALLCVLSFVLCVGCNTKQLVAPDKLQIDEYTLTWDSIENASGYIVDVDGTEYQTQTNSFDLFILTEYRTYGIAIKAIGVEKYKDSDWSEALSYTFEPKGVFAFDSVSGGYELTFIKIGQSKGNIAIPDYYNGSPVISIMRDVFRGNDAVKSVMIPDTVKSIGNNAFESCTELTRIRIPDRVMINIGNAAFFNCTKLTDVTLPYGLSKINSRLFQLCESLENITLPPFITSIEVNAFWGTKLKSITIPQKVTSIGANAFNYCTELENITVEEGNTSYKSQGNCLIKLADNTLMAGGNNSVIPSGVVTIDGGAFCGRSGLKSIAIPSSVTNIINRAFLGCSGLESITVESGNAVYKSQGNCIIRIADNTMILGCKNSVIPNGVESIEYAFYGQTIQAMAIPNSVTVIGDYAFAYSGLKSIVFSSSITKIGRGAFSGCVDLKVVNIPKNVKEIGSDAFSATGLTSVTLHDGIKSIGSGAFADLKEATMYIEPRWDTWDGRWCATATSGSMGVAYVYCPIINNCTLAYDGENPYVVSFSNVIVSSQPPRYTLTAPTRSGYTFMGWSTIEGGLVAEYTMKDNLESISTDITLYAIWIAN